MAVRVTCPACEATFSVGDNMRGKRVPCRECRKSVPVPAGRKRDDDDEDEDDEVEEAVQAKPRKGGKRDDEDDDDERDQKPQKKIRKPVDEDEDEDDEEDEKPSKKTPQKKAPAPQKKASARDEEDEDEDEDDDDEPRKKGGMSPLVWIGAGSGVLIIALVAVFLVMRSGGDKKTTPVAENKPAEHTPPENKPAEPPGTEKKDPTDAGDPRKDPEEKKDPEKKDGPAIDKKDPEKKIDDPPTKKDDPPPDETKKDDPRKPPVAAPLDPVITGANGEKVYQRLLKSTAWVLSPQAKPVIVKVVGGVAVPPGSLIGSVWGGKESLADFGELKFQYVGPDRVVMVNRDGAQQGTYQVADSTKVTMSFLNGAVVYSGTIKEQDKESMMTGTAKNDKETWTWEAAKQEAPLNVGEIPIKRTLQGTGVLVDRKHRLLLTNLHVVGDPESLVIHFPVHEGGALKVPRDHYLKAVGIKGKVVAKEERADLALIQLESLPASAQVLPMSRTSARPAQIVHSLGNPVASRALWIYAPGRVRQVYKDAWKVLDEIEGKALTFDAMKIEAEAPINRGDSGGPLVNDRAILVGVGHGYNMDGQNPSNFIDVTECRALVQKYYDLIGETWVPEAEPLADDIVTRIPELIRKLDRDDFGTRLQAAQTLGGMGPDGSLAFQPLFLAMKKEENAVVKNALEDALEKIPPRPGDLDMLVDICKDQLIATRVRQQAVKSMTRLGSQAKPAMSILYDHLRGADLDLQRLSLEAIAAIGPESRDLPQIVPALKSNNIAVSRQAVETIGKIGSDAKIVVPQLVPLLKKNDKEMKLRVMKALQNIGPVAAKDASIALHDVLKEGDPELGSVAAVTLARLGETKSSLPYLIGLLKSGPQPQRRNTIRLLGTLGNDARTATTDLINSLEDDFLHEDAKLALVKIGKVATGPLSKKMVTSMNAKTRLACVYIVGEIRVSSSEVVTALDIIARKDPVPENRLAALKTLEKLTGGL